MGKPATIRAAFDATRGGGKVILVGAAGIEESVTFPALSLMTDGKTIQGSVYGASDPPRPARPRGVGDATHRTR